MLTISTLENGLTLIVEEMPDVESVAYELLVPGGIILDPATRIGACLVTTELMARGAGKYDSRQLSDAFDALGIRHSESCGFDRFSFRGSMLARNVNAALELMFTIVKEPRFDEEHIPSIKELLIQDIDSIKDNPARWVFTELSAQYFPEPFSRPTHGTRSGITDVTPAELKRVWQDCFKAKGSVLSVAGNVNTQEILKCVHACTKSWGGDAQIVPTLTNLGASGYKHIRHEAAQLQIALAFPSVPFGDPDYYVAKVYSGILSGGMFGRLFIEVREKRGLCYSVYARHSAAEDYGMIMAYAGTTPERAQETLDVMIQELGKVKGTVTAEELERAKANIKTSLVLGEESSSSRASSNAGDWFIAERVRSLDEIKSGIQAVSAKDIDNLLERYKPEPRLIATLGSKALTINA